MRFDLALYRLQHPFRRRLTAYVYIAVIPIAAEPMPAPFQFRCLHYRGIKGGIKERRGVIPIKTRT
jgi:hypothetical protein